MNTKDGVIICLTILLFTGIITFGIVIEDLSENPYEQCIESCSLADKITCTRLCNEGVTELALIVANLTRPIIEDLLNQDELECPTCQCPDKYLSSKNCTKDHTGRSC